MKKIILCLLLLIPAQIAAAASKYLPPDSGERRSPVQLAAIDFILPGYGTFTQDKTLYAAIYFGANIANLGLTYLAYRNWRYYESAYQAAQQRQTTEPDTLQFLDPTGGGNYFTLQDIKNRAERGQLFFAISIVANIALRFFSATHTWILADEARTKAGPRYEFYPDAENGYRLTTSYQYMF